MQLRFIRSAAVGTAVALGLMLGAAAPASAQVSIGVNVGGPAPVCPYGYYGFAPYNCAPYGYYGPQWFTGGAFLGAGPWYRGRVGFYAPVNHDLDPRYGYHGPYPSHGNFHEPADHWHDFHGNDYHGPNGEFHHEGFHNGDHH